MFFLFFSSFAWTQPLLNTLSWYTIHDTVMGGRSKGTIKKDDSSWIFSGYLSKENNGGFASIRSDPPPSQIDKARGLLIRIKGDGRKYLATLRLQNDDRRIYHRMSFQTQADEEQEILLLFSDFSPYAYGRALPNVPGLIFSNAPIRSIGFMLADKKQGPFSLRILSIDTYGARNLSPLATQEQKKRMFASIEVGVPLYNQGDIQGCATTYQQTLTTLQKELQSPWLAEVLANPPSDNDEKAWWFRHTLNQLLSKK